MPTKKHGMWNSRTYKTWQQMKSRCNDKTNASYKFYGEKGITYHSSWEEFQYFLEDMGERPAGMSLDRIDNTQNYSKK